MIDYPVLFGHNSYPFNAHLNADGSANESNVHATTVIDRREINTGVRSLADPYQLAVGGGLGPSRKGFTTIRIGGRMQGADATQEASLADAERAMLAAFDPWLCYRDSPTTEGAYAWDFSESTTDNVNFPSLIRPKRYYVRPDSKPRLAEDLGDDGWRQFGLTLVAPDPRCYGQTERTLSLTPGSASGNCVNIGNGPSPLKVTITMAGAGNAAFTITRAGVSFILNLSTLAAAGVVIVVMETCGPYGRGRYILKNGVETFGLKVSSPSTWLDVPPGTNPFTITNTTNISTCVFNWFDADV